MRCFRIILAGLLLGSCLCAQTPADSREQALARARALVEQRQYDSALALFQEMTRQDPLDRKARTWMARLESWKGNYGQAELLFREILAESDDDEARLGLADVLTWQKKDREAMQVLDTSYQRNPQDPEVLLRLGRLARRQGKRSQALAYYRSLLSREPAQAEASEAVEALLAQQPLWLEAGYFREEFNFAAPANGQFAQLQYRDWNRLFLLARFQFQNKFRQGNTRYTAGLSYRFDGRTWLRSEFSWAPPSHTVIAHQDYAIELSQGLPRSVSIGAGYRRLHFQEADVDAPTSSFDFDPHPRLHLHVAYAPAATRFKSSSQRVWNHNGSARLTWDTHPALRPFLSVAVGSESFSGLSAEQLGRFAAQTYGAGIEWRFARTQGWRMGYYFQNRSQDRHQQGLEVSYFVGF